MAMTPEAKVKKAVKAVLDDLGAWYFMPPGMGMGRSGIPDFVGCYKGRFFAVECKAGSNQPTALQAREIKRIGEAGGIAVVVNEEHVEELRELLVVWGTT